MLYWYHFIKLKLLTSSTNSLQSGINSFKALGSKTAPERVCPPLVIIKF